MDTDHYTPPPEVFTLVDRMAAAYMRTDAEYARELADEARQQWEKDGRNQEREARRKERDREVEYDRDADAYFRTKDGLLVLARIGNEQGFLPYLWKRPCRADSHGFIREPGDTFKPIAIRTYERRGDYHRDGRPIYVET